MLQKININSKSSYSHIFFDVDGVLISSIPYYAKLFRQVAERLGASPNIPDLIYHKMVGEKAEQALASIVPNYNHNKIAEIFNELNQDNQNINYLTLVPQVEQVLNKLKKINKKIALITTKQKEGVDLLINHFSWQKYIDLLISGSDVTKWKPDPEGILKAIDYFQIEKSAVIFIGDSLHDLHAARSAGVDFYGVLTGVCDEQDWQKENVNYGLSVVDII